MSEMPLAKNEIAAQFYETQILGLPIDTIGDETFVCSVDRVAKKAMEIMEKYNFQENIDLAEDQCVISNAQQSEDGAWIYSVRIHTADRNE